jgi:hypothetical protein
MAHKTKVPNFEANRFVDVSHGFVLPPKPKGWPRQFHSVKHCIESAIHMASQIELIDDSPTSFRPDQVREAYFRASLTELCRVEDVTKLLDQQLSFKTSRDPSLHVVKLLRNYQVHIASSQLDEGHTVVALAGEPAVYRSFIAVNVSAAELRRLESAGTYSDNQLEELARLFEAQQRKLGIVQLLYHLAKRVEEFAKCTLTLPSIRRPSVAREARS